MAETMLLRPGRELDALVAEKVMGNRVILGRDKEPVEFYGKYPEGFYAMPRPYSKEIAQAWKVVEELKRRGWYPCVYADDTGDLVPPVESIAWFATLDPNWRNVDAVRGETAAHAICLIALKAMEVAEAEKAESKLSVLRSPNEVKE